jgi:hypothetical protein
MCDAMKSISIVDWPSFRDVFVKAFGFPDFCGCNMDAWIDCMSSLDCPEDGLSSIHVDPGQVVVLDLSGVNSLANRCPEIYEAVVECCAFVNYRRLGNGEPAVLALSLYKIIHNKIIAFIKYYNKYLAKPYKWTYTGKSLADAA